PPPEPGRRLGLGARSAAAPRRRAGARARRPRPWWPHLRVGRRGCRGAPSGRGAPGADPRRRRRRAVARGADGGTRPCGVRARRTRRRAWTVRRPRRSRGRVPGDGPGAAPRRVEFGGGGIEGMRAFPPFTQRALHPVDEAVIYPAAERRLDLVETNLLDEEEPIRLPDDLVPPLTCVDLVWEPDEVRSVWEEEALEPISLDGAASLDPLPSGQPFAFEAQRPALVARGLAEAENELAAFVRAGHRVVVAFPHRGEAMRQQNLLRRINARIVEDGEELPREAELLFAITPARRGFVWRDLGLVLLPDTQVFRRRPPRDRRLGARSLQSFADLRTGDYVVHEDHGIGKLLSSETKGVAGVTRDYLLLAFRGDDRLYVPHEQVGKVSRYIGADSTAPALSKLGGKAWENLKTRARESVREL